MLSVTLTTQKSDAVGVKTKLGEFTPRLKKVFRFVSTESLNYIEFSSKNISLKNVYLCKDANLGANLYGSFIYIPTKQWWINKYQSQWHEVIRSPLDAQVLDVDHFLKITMSNS